MSLGSREKLVLVACLVVLAGSEPDLASLADPLADLASLVDLVGSTDQRDGLVPQVGLGWLVGWRLVHLILG